MPRIDSIIVALSGGKDSLATLDICARHFRRVEAFFLYTVKNLHFQESLFTYLEQRYKIKIWRIPHHDLTRLHGSQLLSWYRPSIEMERVPSQRQVYDRVRDHFGIRWIATGEKKCDSILRRACMTLHGQWDWSRMCYYPLMEWNQNKVWDYNRLRHLPEPADYVRSAEVRAGSFGTLTGNNLYYLRKHCPLDYERVLAVFPFAASMVKRYELYDLPTEIRHRKHEPGADQRSALQPEVDRRIGEAETAGESEAAGPVAAAGGQQANGKSR